MTLRRPLALLLCLPMLSAPLPAAAAEPLDCVIEPRSTVRIGSAEEGLLVELRARRGDLVEKGDIVAALDSDLQRYAAEAARLRASEDIETLSNEARLRFQDTAMARIQDLRDKDFASEQRLEEVRIERDLAQLAVRSSRLQHRIAQIEADNAAARLERRFVRTPVDGVVVSVAMAEGEHVHDQAVIMTVADISVLHVEVFAPIERFADLSVGDAAEVVVPPPLDMRREATVSVIDKVFDAGSGTFGVRLAMDNAAHDMPAGLRCRVRFDVSEGAG